MSRKKGTGMEWVRLNTSFPRNPKVLNLIAGGHTRAVLAYVCSLAYAGEQATDGFIPRAALMFIHARPADAELLVDAGLWLRLPDSDGWDINDWAEYQPSAAQVEARREAGRNAAKARWSNRDNVRSISS